MGTVCYSHLSFLNSHMTHSWGLEIPLHWFFSLSIKFPRFPGSGGRIKVSGKVKTWVIFNYGLLTNKSKWGERDLVITFVACTNWNPLFLHVEGEFLFVGFKPPGRVQEREGSSLALWSSMSMSDVTGAPWACHWIFSDSHNLCLWSLENCQFV